MAKKNAITVDQLLNLTPSDIANMTTVELEQVAATSRRLAQRRLWGIKRAEEKTGAPGSLTFTKKSQDLYQAQKSDRESARRVELRKQIISSRNYLSRTTTTVTGARQYKKIVDAIEDPDNADIKSDLWEIYRHFTHNVGDEVMQAYGYGSTERQQDILKLLQRGKSIDDVKQAIRDKVDKKYREYDIRSTPNVDIF